MDCAVHQGEEALSRCGSCDAPFCDDCLTHLVDDRGDGLDQEPWCAECVKELERDSPWPLPLAFAGIGTIASVVGARALATRGVDWTWLPFLLVVAVTTWFLYIRARWRRGDRIIDVRVPLEEEAPEAALVVSYRDPARPPTKPVRIRTQLPPVSGKRVAVALLVAMVGIGGTTFLLGGLGWLTLAIMATGWWLVWSATFTALVYAGRRVADDLPSTTHQIDPTQRPRVTTPFDVAKLPILLGATGPQSIPIIVALIAILMSVAFVGWLIADLLVAPLFFVGYVTTLAALHHVTREPAEYRGKLGPSLGRGALFALACTVPLAASGAGLLLLLQAIR